ncbi:restriction endonuclease subunit R [Dokdonia pacifica]|uniref:Type I restriction enzyme R protein N terminus (HSDR_N) n=1 Tax=Dokdonia pacifica TaxID=1627892 RepID=A0A238Z349_9FLAO|nr:type I restriction enzyme HsdR N-terminal domain-containing protein [Dokdonia pacifica]GGG08535.1 restriction endonuclease subunit R [Dokdonia pacifica]SNR77692.1 Type I restriction enzyme R protein N terminus (HSDR_N) [Dokdonia pacifica]
MQALDFPAYDFRLKNSENKSYIFDPIRKKFILLTPEEWVRQHVLQFLIKTKGYPASLINVEKEIKIYDTKKRYDIVIFNSDGSIFLIVECKRPKVAITQAVFDQIARYNLKLKASLLMVTNGLHHYYCAMDFEQERYHFLKEIPNYIIK